MSIRDAASLGASDRVTTGIAVRIGSYRFSPSLWPTLVVLVLLPFLLSLGFWQLDRADQKRAWLARKEAAAHRATLELNAALPAYQDVEHRHVRVRGHYDAAHQLLLENQVRDKQAGYLIITPFLTESGQAVLVDRGWLPAAVERSRLPDIAVSEQPLAVQGVIDKGPSVGLRMGAAVAEASWPLRLQYLDYAALAELLPYDVPPYLIRLDESEPQGYRRDWLPMSELGPATHMGYAVQWFGLALALLVIYVVVNTKRTENHSP